MSAGREWSGMQPSASLLSQQRGKTLVFYFHLHTCVVCGLTMWHLYLTTLTKMLLKLFSKVAIKIGQLN